MADYSYLDILINEVKELRNKTEFIEIDTSKCGISYMPTKKTSFVGYKQGYSDYLTKIQKGIKETEKIRSTTKDYLKLIKNVDDELIQIEHYIHGKLDCIFQVHWIEGARYLFPYSDQIEAEYHLFLAHAVPKRMVMLQYVHLLHTVFHIFHLT